MMEPTAFQVLEELIPKLGVRQEIMEGLKRDGTRRWGDFRLMGLDAIFTMTKLVADVEVHLSRDATNILIQFQILLSDNWFNKIPGAKLASTYAPKTASRIRDERAALIKQRRDEEEERICNERCLRTDTNQSA